MIRGLLIPLLAVPLGAQVVEVPTMSVAHVTIDMDAVGPAGPTTRDAINAAAVPAGPADIVRLVATPNPLSIQGLYDTSTTLGRALGLDWQSGGLILVDANDVFDPFDLRIDLAGPSTEFGLAVADWEGPMVLTFFLRGGVVATFTTTPFDAAYGRVKFLQGQGISFDRVDLRGSTTAGNWLLAELHVESGTGYRTFGTGCAGSAGVPSLDVVAGDTPVRGRAFTLVLGNLPPGAGSYAMVYGFSRTSFPGLGSLPFDLAPVGAPGCLLLCDLIATATAAHSGGAATFTLTVPDLPSLEGARFYNQAYVLDSGANALGVVVTNGGAGRIR